MFCAYPLFHRDNIIENEKKIFKWEAQKKFLKRGTDRFATESVFSKEGQIKPLRNTFTKKLWTEADVLGCSSR